MPNRKNLRPPARLPAAYRSIWQALADADGHAASRQALARHLGVSTATLQRILVDGDVPAFPRTKNRRVMHAWARTLTRLALRLDQDPAAWVRATGIPWDPSIQRVVEATRAGLRGAPAPSASAPPAARPRRVAVALQGPLASHPEGGRLSFLEELARRLAAALEPAGRVAIELVPEHEAVRRLTRQDGIDLAVGVWDTGRRRGQGLTILSIPGWEIPLRAVTLLSAEEDAAALAWRRLIGADPPLGCVRLVLEDSPAHGFLRGACGIDGGSVEPVLGPDPASIAASLRRRPSKGDSRPRVFVGDAFTCHEIVAALRSSAFPQGWKILQIEEPEETAPRFGIGIALPSAGRAGWETAVRSALLRDLFTAGASAMGLLYAEAVLQQIAHARSTPPRAGTVLVPRVSPEASEPFVEAFVAGLLEKLAPEDAGLFVPSAWRPSLERVASVRGRETVRQGSTARIAPYCRSCSASLRDPHNQGTSGRYCRYCADEDGRLKPREQVHRLLAGWILGWQGGLSEEEASRRADRLMRAMPAWSAN